MKVLTLLKKQNSTIEFSLQSSVSVIKQIKKPEINYRKIIENVEYFNSIHLNYSTFTSTSLETLEDQ